MPELGPTSQPTTAMSDCVIGMLISKFTRGFDGAQFMPASSEFV